MTSALVTGSPERVGELVAALTAAGCRCHTASDLDELRGALTALGRQQVDVYVQLPVRIDTGASTAIGQVRELLTHGLIARFEATELALPAVRDGGTVVLVAGNSFGDREVGDDQQARYALMRVLSHGILADSHGRRIRSVVLSSRAGVGELTDVVLGERTAREQAVADFVERDSDLSYVDWRLELLSIATNES